MSALSSPPLRSSTKRLMLWSGIALVAIGVLLHLPMYVDSASMGYRMAGMAMDLWMWLGMTALVVGLGLSWFALFAPAHLTGTSRSTDTAAETPDHEPTDRLHAPHWGLILLLILAVAIDHQKPYTFTFILPGVAEEYGVSLPGNPVPGQPPVAVLPFVGIAGTMIGSFLWGYLGDRLGRRPALMFAGILFIATSVCGAMPSFAWNAVMCFIMGLGAGGMLPVAFTLLAETMPTRRRGWLLVLVAGLGTALGFTIAALLAQWLLPHFGWRILWLTGAPSGLLLVLFGRYIPESPRFLLRHGRHAEAHAVLTRFRAPMPDMEPVTAERGASTFSLFTRPFTFVTGGLVACSIGWGVVTYGFLVWLPTNLIDLGISGAQINDLLARSALVALPVALCVAWSYSHWGARLTMVLASLLTAAALGIFTFLGETTLITTAMVLGLVVLVLVGSWAITAVLTPYSTEIYPTTLRARGAAIVAGAGKLGGVAALAMQVTGITPPGLAASAAIALVPILIGGLMLLAYAVETRARSLETVTGAITASATTGGER